MEAMRLLSEEIGDSSVKKETMLEELRRIWQACLRPVSDSALPESPD
jgi:hypothetical protein